MVFANHLASVFPLSILGDSLFVGSQFSLQVLFYVRRHLGLVVLEESLDGPGALLDPTHISVGSLFAPRSGLDSHGLASLWIEAAILDLVTGSPFRHCMWWVSV